VSPRTATLRPSSREKATALYLELAALGGELAVFRDPESPLGLAGQVRFPPGALVPEALERRVRKSADELQGEVLLHGSRRPVLDEDARAIAEEGTA
jgi:hypothetical protein